MKYLILILLSFAATADNTIELTGDLAITGTDQTAETIINYDLEGNAVQLCIGLTLDGTTPPGGGGLDPIEIAVYGYDKTSVYNDTSFAGQDADLINSVSGADLVLNTEGGNGSRYGLNVFITSEQKTIDSTKTYKLKFTRGGEDTVDANNTDLTNSALNLFRGFNFGFVFNKTASQVTYDYNQNFFGYGIDQNGDNIVAHAKLTRLAAYLDESGVGYVSTTGSDFTQNTGYSPTSDLTDGDIELWLVPGATNYTLQLYANDTLITSVATDIPKTSTTLLPYFHLNNWSTLSQYSIEDLSDITVEVL